MTHKESIIAEICQGLPVGVFVALIILEHNLFETFVFSALAALATWALSYFFKFCKDNFLLGTDLYFIAVAILMYLSSAYAMFRGEALPFILSHQIIHIGLYGWLLMYGLVVVYGMGRKFIALETTNQKFAQQLSLAFLVAGCIGAVSSIGDYNAWRLAGTFLLWMGLRVPFRNMSKNLSK